MSTWRLANGWELTTESSRSSYGVPVLVHVRTGEVYGAGDWVGECDQVAGELVHDLSAGADPETLQAVGRFEELWLMAGMCGARVNRPAPARSGGAL